MATAVAAKTYVNYLIKVDTKTITKFSQILVSLIIELLFSIICKPIIVKFLK